MLCSLLICALLGAALALKPLALRYLKLLAQRGEKLRAEKRIECHELVQCVVDFETLEEVQEWRAQVLTFTASLKNAPDFNDQDVLEYLSDLTEANVLAKEKEVEIKAAEEAKMEAGGAVEIETEPWPDVKSALKLSFKENFYSILECDSTTTQKAIKKAFYKMVKKYHPDSFPNDAARQKLSGYQMMVINEAYTTVSGLFYR
ncbi:hypothetical protein B484DRAFT_402721 [Ochromonadaceae sp. CCMP2298]|nr:hypothetical protein B484DRAFT_402721 [Ochromonadaceae sp. CCMP2298]